MKKARSDGALRRWGMSVLLGLGATLGAGPAWAKIGVSSQFIDVVLENLKPGRTYNIRELKGVPYTVKNSGDSPTEIVVEIVRPDTGYVQAPYEPIPDPGWLQVSPARYRLEGGQPGFSDLVISVPDDASLAGRHFYAQVWAHTVETGLLAAGVKSDIRFSIGKGPKALEKEKQRKAMVELNYDLWPSALYVRNAKAGRYDVKREEKKSFKLTNRSEKELELVLAAIPWKTYILPAPAGYEIPEDLKWVRFSPSRVKVAPDSVKEIQVSLEVPQALKGRKVAFLVQLSLPIGVIVGASHQMYVEVP